MMDEQVPLNIDSLQISPATDLNKAHHKKGNKKCCNGHHKKQCRQNKDDHSHYKTKSGKITAERKRISYGVIIYCIFTCLSCLYLQTQCFYPILHDLSKARILTIISYIIVIMAIWSYIQTIRIKNTLPKLKGSPLIIQTIQQIDTDYLVDKCQHCKYYKPPRVAHCSKCGQCIMKMDHHCIWTQNCIGYRNQKSFYLFTLYMTMGLLQFWFATYEIYYYYDFSFSIWVYILWISTSSSAFFVGLMILALWISHTAMIMTNHTTLMSVKTGHIYPLPFCQHRKSISKYHGEYHNQFDRGQIQNMRSMFGCNSILCAFLPLAREPYHDFLFEPPSPHPTNEQISKFTGFYYEQMLIQKQLLQIIPRYIKTMKGKKFIINEEIIIF